jgi:CBS domain-containing protein
MSNVEETLVPLTATVKQVIETIEQSQAKVALVVDGQRRLLGTVTDGDVRGFSHHEQKTARGVGE